MLLVSTAAAGLWTSLWCDFCHLLVMPEFTGDSSINMTDSISAFTDHLRARIHFIAKIRGSHLKMKCSPWQNFGSY